LPSQLCADRNGHLKVFGQKRLVHHFDVDGPTLFVVSENRHDRLTSGNLLKKIVILAHALVYI
jgi:hypothetical protein